MEKKIDNTNTMTDDLEILDTLRVALKSKENLWVWQQPCNEKRKVSYCLLRKVDPIKKFCEIMPIKSYPFKFDDGGDYYILSEKFKFLLKLEVIEFNPMFIRFALPASLDKVVDEYIDNIELVEVEDEESNLHRRYTLRRPIRDDKLTGLYKIQDNQEILGFYITRDISSGGMSFFIDDPSEFEEGQELKIISVGEKEFKKPMPGIVRSIRQVKDEFNAIRFKVGVQFLKG